jgi:hypothetical protein
VCFSAHIAGALETVNNASDCACGEAGELGQAAGGQWAVLIQQAEAFPFCDIHVHARGHSFVKEDNSVAEVAPH